MDGFALRNADAALGARFRVIGESFAGGELPPQIGASETVRIFTGAALPLDADRVVMQKNCALEDRTMTITTNFGPGWHVRNEASDFAAGELAPASGSAA